MTRLKFPVLLNRILLKVHVTAIPFFLLLYQQSSPCVNLNVRRAYSYTSLVLKKKLVPFLLVHRSVRFLVYPHEMRSTSGLYHIQVPLRYLRDFLVQNSMSIVRHDIPVDFNPSMDENLSERMMYGLDSIKSQAK
jgi:hypothetical protein